MGIGKVGNETYCVVVPLSMCRTCSFPLIKRGHHHCDTASTVCSKTTSKLQEASTAYDGPFTAVQTPYMCGSHKHAYVGKSACLATCFSSLATSNGGMTILVRLSRDFQPLNRLSSAFYAPQCLTCWKCSSGCAVERWLSSRHCDPRLILGALHSMVTVQTACLLCDGFVLHKPQRVKLAST